MIAHVKIFHDNPGMWCNMYPKLTCYLLTRSWSIDFITLLWFMQSDQLIEKIGNDILLWKFITIVNKILKIRLDQTKINGRNWKRHNDFNYELKLGICCQYIHNCYIDYKIGILIKSNIKIFRTNRYDDTGLFLSYIMKNFQTIFLLF